MTLGKNKYNPNFRTIYRSLAKVDPDLTGYVRLEQLDKVLILLTYKGIERERHILQEVLAAGVLEGIRQLATTHPDPLVLPHVPPALTNEPHPISRRPASLPTSRHQQHRQSSLHFTQYHFYYYASSCSIRRLGDKGVQVGV